MVKNLLRNLQLYSRTSEYKRLGNKEITVKSMITEKFELVPIEIELYERFRQKEYRKDEDINRN